eukprot:UN04095
MYSGLWAYTSVFITTTAESTLFHLNEFWLCIIFFAVCFPLTLFELEDQTVLQLVLCCIRIFNISIISLVTLINMGTKDINH